MPLVFYSGFYGGFFIVSILVDEFIFSNAT